MRVCGLILFCLTAINWTRRKHDNTMVLKILLSLCFFADSDGLDRADCQCPKHTQIISAATQYAPDLY